MNKNKKNIDEILRVNHAGEYGAQIIYNSQIRFSKNNLLKKELKRISKPSLRKYSGASDLESVKSGLGSFILSTNLGLMTDRDAKAKNVGGEILCEVF